MGRRIDVLTLLQLWEWNAACDKSPPDHIATYPACIQYELVVPWLRVADVGSKRCVESGRAVSCQFVVPLGMILQFIQVIDISKEHGARCFRLYLDAVQVNLLVFPVVCAQSNNIALISCNQNQLVLTKKSENRRVRLISFVACLNGECYMVIVSKLKADNWVAREGYSPVRQE